MRGFCSQTHFYDSWGHRLRGEGRTTLSECIFDVRAACRDHVVATAGVSELSAVPKVFCEHESFDYPNVKLGFRSVGMLSGFYFILFFIFKNAQNIKNIFH